MSTSSPSDLEGFFQDYQSELLARLKRIVGCADTAADLAQETYLRLMRTPHVRDIAHPRAYLHRIATNLALDHLRKEKLRLPLHATLEDASVVPSSAPAPLDEIYGKQRLAVFQDAFQSLEATTRNVLWLRRVQGCSHEVIADRLKLTKRQVENHLAKALYHCQKALDDEAGA
ncbi:DNA-directed RNA polymerase sigma-70 factor [Nitrospira sp. KM1]|uniref:RNA polymerase sigma factor n=1 Tax=Nitrospira sp. KM1 TaxID=1936990 RepID=UPI0013A770BC|nr:RNA polymerase sigma factor [Nitrospira sp. KM1]BCA56573.1 DNA-directed RNA polymerase sigma-70 factor [Nitrospira sp. KM1]